MNNVDKFNIVMNRIIFFFLLAHNYYNSNLSRKSCNSDAFSSVITHFTFSLIKQNHSNYIYEIWILFIKHDNIYRRVVILVNSCCCCWIPWMSTPEKPVGAVNAHHTVRVKNIWCDRPTPFNMLPILRIGLVHVDRFRLKIL